MIRQKQLSADEAYARLADRCSVAEVCTGEALEKLRKWGISGRAAYGIVQRLVDERFIDDERFARMWVRDRLYTARWGLMKIRAAARLKQLADEVVGEAIEEVFDGERYAENLASALRSKARQMTRPLSYDDRARLMRFAVGRGYEPAVVQDMLRHPDSWLPSDDERLD